MHTQLTPATHEAQSNGLIGFIASAWESLYMCMPVILATAHVQDDCRQNDKYQAGTAGWQEVQIAKSIV